MSAGTSAARPRGLFITFEGGEGSGKSTQARLLFEHLAAIGRDVVLTREPGGTRLGEQVRRVLLHPDAAGMDPLTELFLYFAARREHVVGLIRPSLNRGALVISDRFSDATLAYQGAGRHLDTRLIRRLNRLACGGLEPDLTILVDLASPEEGLRRARSRDRSRGAAGVSDRYEREAVAFHRKVIAGYRKLARRHPGRIAVVDGGPPATVVQRNVLDLLPQRFPEEAWTM